MKTTPILIVLALMAVGCSSEHRTATAPVAMQPSVVTANGVASSITFDQGEAAVRIETGWPAGGTHVGKQFDASPHTGDAIVATFTWRGSANTITTVTDHLEDGTPVGNTYTLVDYVTADGWSMATYIATNVHGFPDPAPTPAKILAVHAIFSDTITDASELIAAYRGVSPVTALALGAHSAAAGNGAAPTIADPGPIAVDAGTGIHAFTAANAVVDLASPPELTGITAAWDAAQTMKIEGDRGVATGPGTIEPKWTWSFNAPSTWFATAVALNPQVATHLAFVVEPSGTILPGQTISPPVQVDVLDDQGQTVTGFEGSVAIALGHDGSVLHNARLSGTVVASVVNGVATFTDLSIDEPGMGYTLQASTGNLAGATSDPFNVTFPFSVTFP